MARRRWSVNLYGERREIAKRWPDGSYQCPWCSGPVMRALALCGNPACEANPATTRETADKWRAAQAAREAEARERERIVAIRARMREPMTQDA